MKEAEIRKRFSELAAEPITSTGRTDEMIWLAQLLEKLKENRNN